MKILFFSSPFLLLSVAGRSVGMSVSIRWTRRSSLVQRYCRAWWHFFRVREGCIQSHATQVTNLHMKSVARCQGKNESDCVHASCCQIWESFVPWRGSGLQPNGWLGCSCIWRIVSGLCNQGLQLLTRVLQLGNRRKVIVTPRNNALFSNSHLQNGNPLFLWTSVEMTGR